MYNDKIVIVQPSDRPTNTTINKQSILYRLIVLYSIQFHFISVVSYGRQTKYHNTS